MGHDRRAHIENRALQPQEALLLRIFAQSERLTILDAGACEGDSAVRYARLFPKARIYAVEPLPGNLAMITRNVAEYGTPNVTPVEGCLSDADGEAVFHVSSGSPLEHFDTDQDWDFGNKSSSLLAPERTVEVHPWLEFGDEVTVKTMRLDGLAARLGVDAIDFFHLDVQGAELMVLQGAGTLLPRIRTLWLEVEAVELYRGQPVKSDMGEFLRRAGFVRLIDTVDEVSGDQFWAQSAWLRGRMGLLWAWAERLRVSGVGVRLRQGLRRAEGAVRGFGGR
jgi:FkbM family methyltransferase